MNYTQDQLIESYKKLPEDVKEAMFAVESADKIQTIGKKHKLHIDQVGELGTQTGLVMLGVLPPKDFVKAITDKLNVNQDLARLIAADINTEIFTPIRESLKKIHHLDFSGEVKTPEQSPQPTTEPAKEPLISAFAAKTSDPVATNQQESVITPSNQSQKPKKDFDPYRESI